MKHIATTLLLAGLITSAAHAQLGVPPMPPSRTTSPAPKPMPSPNQPAEFNDGIKAMNDGHWKEALANFQKVHSDDEDTMAQSLYWLAYNQQKLGRVGETTGTCVRLRSQYPQSSWNNECAQLQANQVVFVRSHDIDVDTAQYQAQANVYAEQAKSYAEGQTFNIYGDPHTHTSTSFSIHTSGKVDPEDEIRLIALNSLMQNEPDKALPAIRNLLNSNKSVETKRRAMFVLEQSKSPEAQKLLADTAASNSTPELQRAAVWAIASRPKEHTAELVTIYKASSDHEVKRAAASGLMSAHDATDLVTLARGESDPDVKRTLVSYLGDMKDPTAIAYMEELVK